MSVAVAKYAATQSVAEVGIGAALHALKVPMTGHLLSINQGAILTFAVREQGDRRSAMATAAGVASVASILKSLAPVGKRLTPMLAICIQGWLYSLGLAVAGVGPWGVALGMSLLALWAFAQPLILAYLFFGATFFSGIEKLWTELAQLLSIPYESGVWILAGVAGLKCLIASALGVWILKSGAALEARYQSRLDSLKSIKAMKARKSGDIAPAWRGGLKDLLTPWFVLGLTLSIGFLILSGDTQPSRIWVYAIRAVAVGWLFFWALRALPAEWITRGLKRFPQVRAALAHLKTGPQAWG